LTPVYEELGSGADGRNKGFYHDLPGPKVGKRFFLYHNPVRGFEIDGKALHRSSQTASPLR
jgi:hypothetical protein